MKAGLLVSSPSVAAPVRFASAGCAMLAAERKDRTDNLFRVELTTLPQKIQTQVDGTEIILIELWAGVASLSQAFEEHGIQPTAFSEIDPALLQRLKNRHRKALFTGDFNCLEWRSWKFNKNAIIIVVGGPPCTALSKAGKQLRQNDKASNGIMQTMELAVFFGAHIIVLENVPELITDDAQHGLLSDAVLFAQKNMLRCVAQLTMRDSEFGGFTQRLRAFIIFERKRATGVVAWNISTKQYRMQSDVIPSDVLLSSDEVPEAEWLAGRLQMTGAVAKPELGRAAKIAVLHRNELASKQEPVVGDLVRLKREEYQGNRWRVLQTSDDTSQLRLLRSDHRHPTARTVFKDCIQCVLAETINVFDPLRCSVTLRHWGEPPIHNGALILQSLNGQPRVRPLSPIEIWRLQRLPLSNIQELRDCGLSDSDIGAAAGNSIPFGLSKVIASEVASRAVALANAQQQQRHQQLQLRARRVKFKEVSKEKVPKVKSIKKEATSVPSVPNDLAEHAPQDSKVIVIPILMDLTPRVLVGRDLAFPLNTQLLMDAKTQSSALEIANALACEYTGAIAKTFTFLAALLPGDVFIFALPLRTVPDKLTSFEQIQPSQLFGTEYEYVMLALNAVLSMAAPFPHEHELPPHLSLTVPEHWRQAQLDLLANTEVSGRVAARMLAESHAPSGALFDRMQAAVEASKLANAALRTALKLHAKECSSQVSQELLKWADAVTQVPWIDLPPMVYLEMDDFSNAELATCPIPQPCPAIISNWLPRAQQQLPRIGFNPSTIADLLTPDAVRRIDSWMKVQLRFLREIEKSGAKAIRASNVPLALGQDCFKEEARGIVWDLRKLKQGIITPLDFQAPLTSHLNLDLFRSLLRDHPDQELLSFITEGVRYKADLKLQIVLLPHLISLRDGYSSLKSEVEKYKAQGWYGVFDHPPFLPYRAVPKGSVVRRLEPDRPRPTTEATAPRKLLLDTQGVPVISLNHASSGIPPEQCYDPMDDLIILKSHHTSLKSSDPVIQMIEKQARQSEQSACITESAITVDNPWPKEAKPRVSHLLIALAVLLHVAGIMQEPIFLMADDFKNFFNQLMLAPEDIWKCGLILSDLIGPVFAAEYMMTFGLRPASNIAQRFADAILWLFRKRLVAREEEFWEEEERTHPGLGQWRRDRQDISSEIDQTQLFAIFIYTDDPAMVVVGARRMARALQVWAELTSQLGLLMASANKRQCGTHISWLGAGILAGTGYAWVPKAKILRCIAQLQSVLQGLCQIDTYHSLLGLLEHLIFMTSIGRRMMLGLWHPFRKGFLPEPNLLVIPTPQMKVSIQLWIQMLSTHAGASALRSVIRGEIPRSSTIFTVYGDAWASPQEAGLGGWCHGYFWEHQLTSRCSAIPIAVLEFIAQWVSFYTFSSILPTPVQQQGHWSHWLHLRADALSTPIILRSESPHSRMMEAVLAEAVSHPEFDNWRRAIQVSHVFGVGNEMADAASRADFDRLNVIAHQLGIHPRRIQYHPMLQKLLRAAKRSLSPVERATAEAVANTPTKASFMKMQMSEQQLADLGIFVDAKKTVSNKQAVKSTHITPEKQAAVSKLTTTKYATKLQLSEQQLVGMGIFIENNNTQTDGIPQTVSQAVQAAAGHTKSKGLIAVRHEAVTRASPANQARSNEMYSPPPKMLAKVRPRLRDLQQGGYKINTTNIESGHWKYWTRFCAANNLNLWRDDHAANNGTDRAGFQEEVDILAAFILEILATMPARHPRPAPLPSSAANVVRGIRRIHAKQNPPIIMVPFSAVMPIIRGLNREYMAAHTYNMLLPMRKQPWRKSWLIRMCAVRNELGTVLGSQTVDQGCFCTSFFALWETLLQTGFRKSEVAVQHVSLFSSTSHLTRASLSWCIDKVIITDPDTADFAQVRENDYAIINPPPSKTDQFGVIWGDKPIFLHVRHRNFMCAALRLLEIERRFPLRGERRAQAPLFTMQGNTPFTFSAVTTTLNALKDIALPASVDHSLYTTHSCRIYLCTALGAAGKSSAEIQAICRWQSVESVQIYNRMQPADYARHLDDAAQATITSYLMIGAPIISSRHLMSRVSAAS